MTKSKFLHRLFILFFMGCTMCTLQACSDNNEEEILSDLAGTWYYYKLHDANKGIESEHTYTFNSDGSGSGKYSFSGSVYWSESRYYFTYSVNGKTIQCKGNETYVSSEGDFENKSWSKTFTYENGKLKSGDQSYSKM